ncbi:MAG: hypothetical protein M3Z02_03470 [Actinomycetota bacterium]|nr:hypothetical protein [Actinomycetota bacterium]
MRSNRRDYQVYALDEDGSPRRLVASAATFEAALAERDRDVLAQLRAGGGRTLTVTHEIVGPGLAGSQTVHPVTSSLGVEGGVRPAELEALVADAGVWLEVIHGRR